MDRPIDLINKPNIEKEIINKFLGIPYAEGGRDEKKGLNCFGLTLKIYKMLGVEIFDCDDEKYKDFSQKDIFCLIETQYRDFYEVKEPEFLDVIMVRHYNGVACHTGVVLSNGRFIHASKNGVIVMKYTGAFKSNIGGFYRSRVLYGE